MTVAILKKRNRKLGREYLKTWVEIIHVGIFQGVFSSGGEFNWGKFSVWELSWYRRKYMRRILKFTCIDIDLSEKSWFSKPIASVFIPAPLIFSYGVEMFLHPLVELIGHLSVLIGYIEMYISHHICSFEFF